MEEFKPRLCVICRYVTSDTSYRVVEETIGEMLDVLLLQRPVEVGTSVICEICYTKVFEAFRFKTMCTDTENSLFPYVNSKYGAPIDLKEIYLKKRNKEEFRNVREQERICRLCIQIVTSRFTSVKDLELDLLCKYIPEVNFNLTEEPILCMICAESLKSHGSFLSTCFGLQTFENISKDEVMDGQFRIKTEEIEIKSEGNDEDIDHDPADESTVYEWQSQHGLTTQLLKAGEDNCNTRSYQIPRRVYLVVPQLNCEKLFECPTRKCDMCDYTTKHKGNLVIHQLRHKDMSEMPLFKCDKCSYRTKRMKHLITHQATHKSISDTQLYKCDSCFYETKFKSWFEKHQQKHQIDSEKCNVQTKYKNSLDDHELVHKDVSEVQMYTCDKCSFETKFKKCLVSHQLRHKDASEVQLYTCASCSYHTKFKSCLVSHQLTHKYSSQVKWYKCDTCSFESKHKRSIIRHKQRHTRHF